MKKKLRRSMEVAVISDVHLGTYGCQAKELLQYLKSINPKILILNGDIIDIWQFNKRYWPKSHMRIIKHLTKWLSQGKKIYYVTGNHDEMLRRFNGFEIGNFKIVNKVVLELEDKKAWVFHGDVFDVTMQHSKWLAKLGAVGYDSLILINTLVNFIAKTFGKGKISLSKKIKNSVKSAVKFINNFETVASEIAIENNYDFVLCGHIHQPEIKSMKTDKGKVLYLNSGDWVENCTALEYYEQQWHLYKYDPTEFEADLEEESLLELEMNHKDLFSELVKELSLTPQPNQ